MSKPTLVILSGSLVENLHALLFSPARVNPPTFAISVLMLGLILGACCLERLSVAAQLIVIVSTQGGTTWLNKPILINEQSCRSLIGATRGWSSTTPRTPTPGSHPSPRCGPLPGRPTC